MVPVPMRTSLFALVAGLLLSGCASERPKLRGHGCELNTECEAPLVCRLGRCRVECRDHVDCAASLQCLFDDERLGGCQLPDELEPCTLDSQCRERCGGRCDQLVCRDGRCGQACVEDRDCPHGATCEVGAAGVHTCEVQEPRACLYDSDCRDGLVCDYDQVCRLECLEDRDCDYPRTCSVDNRCVLPDGGF